MSFDPSVGTLGRRVKGQTKACTLVVVCSVAVQGYVVSPSELSVPSSAGGRGGALAIGSAGDGGPLMQQGGPLNSLSCCAAPALSYSLLAIWEIPTLSEDILDRLHQHLHA